MCSANGPLVPSLASAGNDHSAHGATYATRSHRAGSHLPTVERGSGIGPGVRPKPGKRLGPHLLLGPARGSHAQRVSSAALSPSGRDGGGEAGVAGGAPPQHPGRRPPPELVWGRVRARAVSSS
jgi:hypothetical protein